MIGFHNLLGKKCLYPVFVASATPLMGAGSPSSQKNHPTSSDGHPSLYPDIPDTLAYQVTSHAVCAVPTLPYRLHIEKRA